MTWCHVPLRKRQDTARATVETDFPHVAEWVDGCGEIELGNQDWQGLVVSALNDGGLVFEQEGCRTLGEALAALEDGSTNWFRRNGWNPTAVTIDRDQA